MASEEFFFRGLLQRQEEEEGGRKITVVLGSPAAVMALNLFLVEKFLARCVWPHRSLFFLSLIEEDTQSALCHLLRRPPQISENTPIGSAANAVPGRGAHERR